MHFAQNLNFVYVDQTTRVLFLRLKNACNPIFCRIDHSLCLNRKVRHAVRMCFSFYEYVFHYSS